MSFTSHAMNLGSIAVQEIASPLAGARMLEFPGNPEGPRQISFAEFDQHLPFEVRRVYWIHSLHAGEGRGQHAHRNMQQVLIPVSGEFSVTLDDGFNTKTFSLNSPTCGLLVPPGLWRVVDTLASHSVLLSLASTHFDESDYIRSYPLFLDFVHSRTLARGIWELCDEQQRQASSVP